MTPAARSLSILVSLAVAVVSAPAAQAGSRDPGKELWTARYTDHPSHYAAEASAVAVSHDGTTVFVTGISPVRGPRSDFGTIAYDAASGKQRWVARYHGSPSYNRARAMALSPDGSIVFVTGESEVAGMNFATVAYDATTGTKLWAKRYDGGGHDNEAYGIAASPDGSLVFVTGPSAASNGVDDYATVAYATTGTQRWVMRYDGPSHDYDIAQAIAVSPDSSEVFVTGGSEGPRGLDYDYATVAYDASTGTQLWARRYNGPPHSVDGANAITVGPDSAVVFVTGAIDPPSGPDYETIAYEKSTGKRLWAARYDGPAGRGDVASSIAASPNGTAVFVTGRSAGSREDGDFATVAYDAVTGEQRWAVRYSGPAHSEDGAVGIAVSPDGGAVFVTGTSAEDYLTAAYGATTGTRLWIARYGSPHDGLDEAAAIAIGADGKVVFVTGSSGADYLTVAYAAS